MSATARRCACVLVAVLALLGLTSLGANARPESPSKAPVAAPKVVVAPNCGSTQIPKPGGGYWTCTFGDDFTSSVLDTSKWSPQLTSASGFGSPAACYVDTANNVSIADGALNLTARKEPKPFTCASATGNYATQYTSGMVSTWNKFSQAYGRFEIRAKFPAAKVAGLQSSLWLWPQNLSGAPWPYDGEIDIAETYSALADRAIPYIHYVPAVYDPNVTNNYCMISDLSAYHTYVAEWTPTSITISYDGQTCVSDSWTPFGLVKPAPFNKAFMIALTQGLGVGANAFNPLTTPLPATTSIDYVHVWK
jgi:beta-glucanase (GH16 family)